jgi:hypothetical protein
MWCSVTSAHVAYRNAQKGQMRLASSPSADNQSINGLDCDCGHGHEKIRVRCCALVAACACHPVLSSVTVSCRSPSPTTLKQIQNQSQTMISTQTRTLDRRQRRQTRLMTWHGHSSANRRNCGDRAARRTQDRGARMGISDEYGYIPLCPFLGSIRVRLLLLPLLLFGLQDPIRSSAPIQRVRAHNQNPSTAQNRRWDNTDLFLNSSGTSTDGLPSASAFNFARRRGSSSCAVRDGRETYGRVALHSYVK